MKILEEPTGSLKLPAQIKTISKQPIINDNKASGIIINILTPRKTPTLEPIKTARTMCQQTCFQKKNTRATKDANAKSGIKGTATVIGKTADPEANKIQTPPVAKAALTNAAIKLPK